MLNLLYFVFISHDRICFKISGEKERLERGGPCRLLKQRQVGTKEVNGRDSRSTYERDTSLIGSLGSSSRYKIFLSAASAAILVSLHTKS